MIITFGGIKGGCGKSLWAVHAAVIRARAGRRVLLVDADRQHTAATFAEIRAETLGEPDFSTIQLEGRAIAQQAAKLANSYDDVVIDVGGRDSIAQRAALTVSHRLVSPVVPSGFDVWTIAQLEELVEEARGVNPNLDGITALNKAEPRSAENAEAANYLRERTVLRFREDLTIMHRRAYKRAVGDGRTVVEMKGRDVQPAIEEITRLVDAAFALELVS